MTRDEIAVANARGTRAPSGEEKVTLPRVRLYHNPNTSEASGEWDTVRDAICEAFPRSVESRLVSNGTTIARGSEEGGQLNWTLTTAAIERMHAERGRGPFGEPITGPTTYTENK